MKKFLCCLTLASVTSGCVEPNAPAPAIASVTLIDGTDVELIAAVLRENGYRAEIDQQDDGDPEINSGSQGVKWRLLFYACKENSDCSAVQFNAGLDLIDGVAESAAHTWNGKKRYGTSIIDDEGDPWLDFDINLKGGVTKENFEHSLALWEGVLADYLKHVGWRQSR